MSKPENILIIRNDKLGDFMLAWPALSLLKQQYPETTITVLIPAYTKPMADICPWIDDCIIDDQHKSVLSDAIALKNKIKNKQFDAVITLHSQSRTGLAVWLSGIPVRIAPASKLAQIFYNKKLIQRRSRSEKPEYIYNVDLVRFFIRQNGEQDKELQSPPYLTFDFAETASIKEKFKQKHNIDNSTKLVFIHPGTGGSAVNLSLQQFAELAKNLYKTNDLYFVITAGPNELKTAKSLALLLQDIEHTVYHSTKGLVFFSHFIAISDLFISGSTGPLHIAGALNIPTAAFYSARRSATSLRWQTLNEKNKRFSFSPKKYLKSSKKLDIDISMCAGEVSGFLAKPHVS